MHAICSAENEMESKMEMKSEATKHAHGTAIANMPWERRPAGCSSLLWRYSGNPIINRHPVKGVDRVYNSAVVPFNGKFAGVFRCDTDSMLFELRTGFSDDGVNWSLAGERIDFDQSGRAADAGAWLRGYDPRVVEIDGRFYVSWCNVYEGAPTIGLAWTDDFKSFHQMENAFLPYNRNGVLLPRKIDGKYAMLSRPSDNTHTPFGDIYLSLSPDMIHWGCHRLVMKAGQPKWCCVKIGAGPTPIETEKGWLLIYHGVIGTCNGFVYSFGTALLDRERPWKVLKRPAPFLLTPETDYECSGFTPNVAFPCAALVDALTGRMAIYYGAADSYTALAFGYLQEILDFTIED